MAGCKSFGKSQLYENKRQRLKCAHLPFHGTPTSLEEKKIMRWREGQKRLRDRRNIDKLIGVAITCETKFGVDLQFVSSCLYQ
jgi:hypothetical protein